MDSLEGEQNKTVATDDEIKDDVSTGDDDGHYKGDKRRPDDCDGRNYMNEI